MENTLNVHSILLNKDDTMSLQESKEEKETQYGETMYLQNEIDGPTITDWKKTEKRGIHSSEEKTNQANQRFNNEKPLQ